MRSKWLAVSIATAVLVALVVVYEFPRTQPIVESSSGQDPNSAALANATKVLGTGDSPKSPDEVTSVGVITFPDGEEFTIRFKDAFPNSPIDYLPKGLSLAHAYHDLAAKADSGDVQAAALLYKALLGCRSSYYSTEERYEKGRNEIMETGTGKDVDPISGEVTDYEVASDDIDIALMVLEQTYTTCRWVTDDMKDEVLHWKRRAAELGEPQITVDLVVTEEGNTAAGRQKLRDVFLSGYYFRAGRTLGSYLLGVRTPHIAESDSLSLDLWQMQVDGYAYRYLTVLLSDADRTLGGKSSSFSRSTHMAFEQAVAHMSHSDQQAGITRAKEILKSYSGCCQSSLPYSEP